MLHSTVDQQLVEFFFHGWVEVTFFGSRQEALDPVSEENTFTQGMELTLTPRESLESLPATRSRTLEEEWLASRPTSADAAQRPLPRSILRAVVPRSSSMDDLRFYFGLRSTSPRLLDTPRRSIKFSDDCKACPASIMPAQPSPRRWIAESLVATLEKNTATVAVSDAVRAAEKNMSKFAHAASERARAGGVQELSGRVRLSAAVQSAEKYARAAKERVATTRARLAA